MQHGLAWRRVFFGVALGQLLVANGRNNHAKHSTKSSIGSIVTLHFESAIKVVYLVRCKASVYSFIYNHSFHSKWLKITKNKSPRTPRACVQQSGPKSGFWPSFKSRAINEILVDFDNLVCWVTAVPGPKKQQRFRQIPQLCLREVEKCKPTQHHEAATALNEPCPVKQETRLALATGTFSLSGALLQNSLVSKSFVAF